MGAGGGGGRVAGSGRSKCLADVTSAFVSFMAVVGISVFEAVWAGCRNFLGLLPLVAAGLGLADGWTGLAAGWVAEKACPP